MKESKTRECPSCGNQTGSDVNRCALCGYVFDLDKPVIFEQAPDIAAHDFIPDEGPPDASRKISQPIAWIIVIMIMIGTFLLIKELNARQVENSAQLIIKVHTHTPKIINTPTISIIENKDSALKTAERFSILMEEGDEGIKVLIAPDSQHYDDLLESINKIVHDTLKYGKYIKIYGLSISNYSSQNVIISGFLENRSFSGWLKYYLDIYLSKYGNSWLITSWTLVKT